MDLKVHNHVWGGHATESFAMDTAIWPNGPAERLATPTVVLPV